jgi:hypothetical protein
MKQRLDTYDTMPKAMKAYLSNYGWHFNKKLCEWAISMMRDRNKAKLPLVEKDKVESMLKQHGVEITTDKMYDAMYVLHMAKADFMGSSIADEMHLAKYVGDYINDPDGYDGIALTRFYADCMGKGIGIEWEDVL